VLVEGAVDVVGAFLGVDDAGPEGLDPVGPPDEVFGGWVRERLEGGRGQGGEVGGGGQDAGSEGGEGGTGGGRSVTTRMPREDGPKAERRVGKGTVLDLRAERETVIGLPVLGGRAAIGVGGILGRWMFEGNGSSFQTMFITCPCFESCDGDG
jgi:hypothetical protein